MNVLVGMEVSGVVREPAGGIRLLPDRISSRPGRIGGGYDPARIRGLPRRWRRVGVGRGARRE